MEIVFSIINTILLVLIFFYQKNKNKILSERISEQTNLLNETKSVVSQQKTAIESQSSIVDSAVKYTEVFNTNKLEEIITREVSIEKKEEIENLKGYYKKNIADLKLEQLTQVNKALELGISHSCDFLIELFKEPFAHYIDFLMNLDEEERQLTLESLESQKAQRMLRSTISLVKRDSAE